MHLSSKTKHGTAGVLEDSPAETSSNPNSNSNSLAELHAVLDSKLFERSLILRVLLVYLWNHQHEDVSEYAIAIDALGRRPDFDPKYDATVRVQLSRLRKRLKEFYETEGSDLNSRIEIPLGGHRLQVANFDPARPPDLQPPATPAVTEAYATPSQAFRPSIFSIFVTSIVVASLGFAVWRFGTAKREDTPRSMPQLASFWKQQLDNGKPSRIVVSATTFFRWNFPSKDQFLVRDANVNDYAHLDDSDRLATLKKSYGNPQLDEDFISAPDTFALTRLVLYFGIHGRQIPFYSENDSPAGLNNDNVIVLSNFRNMASYRIYSDRLTFRMDAPGEAFVDRNPGAGQSQRFAVMRESPTRSISPGLIAVLPGNGGAHIILLVASFDTSSLVAYLTSDKGLRELDQARARHGNCPYFEAVILTERNSEILQKSWLAELKPHSSSAQISKTVSQQ